MSNPNSQRPSGWPATPDWLGVLGASTQPAYHRIVRLTRQALRADTATITLNARHSQWAHVTSDPPPQESERTEQPLWFGTLERTEGLVVPDARADQRFRDLPMVQEGQLCFYAGVPITARDGQQLGVLSVTGTRPRTLSTEEQQLLRDCAALVTTELELRLAERERAFHHHVLSDLSEAVISTDLQFRVRTWNAPAARMYGWQEQDVTGRDLLEMASTELVGSSPSDLRQHLLTRGAWEAEVRQARADGAPLHVHVKATLLRDAHGEPDGFVLVKRDVSEPRALMTHLQKLVFLDSLTGLPNRVMFQEHLKQACYTDRQQGTLTAVGLLDLDHFKSINDTFGHAVGDELLKLVAGRLKGVIRADSTLARISGDDFAILIPNLEREPDLTAIAQRLTRMFDQPFHVAGHELFVRGSLGMAVYPLDTSEDARLLSRAEIGMHHAKRNALPWSRFSATVGTPASQQLTLETALHHALERGELSVHYQPVMLAGTRVVHGMEALLRWTHPDFGPVDPLEFIPLAERTGLIVPLGEWVLREACAHLAAWRALRPALRMGVNLSARQFHDPQLASTIQAVLREHDLPNDALVLEVTESVLVSVPEAEQALRHLRELGVRLSIDDFGMQNSSMTYLKRVPMNTLKLPRAFLEDVEERPDGLNATIVRSLVQLARSIGLNTVLKGVETPGQARFAEDVGGTLLQGWLFGRAMPADAMTAFLRQQ